MGLRILFLTVAHNSMSQRAYLELTEDGHTIHVEIAFDAEQMIDIYNKVNPDVVICPFMTKRVPKEIWSKSPCLIVHPGIKGDRGPSSLDWALKEGEKEWGVTILQAVEEMDAGDIYSAITFPLTRSDDNSLTKSSLYKNEIIDASIKGLREALHKIQTSAPLEPLNYANKDVRGKLRPSMRLTDRAINWTDDAAVIAREVRAADGRPGVPAVLAGENVFLHGAHVETELNKDGNHTPGTLIAKRAEAVCVACGNNSALWFTALRKKNVGVTINFKQPATFVLSEAAQTLEESSYTLEGAPTGTWKEIWTETTKDGICYLHFNFHNGAMSTPQCRRLTEVCKKINAKTEVKVVVLMGGQDYFSNGIHLNVIQAAEDPAQESWDNINAIDDVVAAVMQMTKKVTISAMQGNAGAGGVMMALGADFVYQHGSVVLNPHYKSMHLYGSEYWTFNLPRRTGHEVAMEITEGMQPMSAKQAKACGLVDDVLGSNLAEFLPLVRAKAESMTQTAFHDAHIKKKSAERTEEFFAKAEEARSNELNEMKKSFASPHYNEQRRMFVYKESCGCTPNYFPKLVAHSCVVMQKEAA